MEPQYYVIDYDREVALIDLKCQLQQKCESIDFPAKYSIDDLGHTLVRIFFYPSEGQEFTKSSVGKLCSALNKVFGIINKRPPNKTKDCHKDRYRWNRDFRKNEGTFHYTRYLKEYWPPTDDNSLGIDMYLLIERAPKLNCRVEKKEIQTTVYKAICD